MDYFERLRQNMVAVYGQDALRHPSPGFSNPVPETAQLASILPPLSDFSHINKPYDTPIVARVEPLVIESSTAMEVDQ